MRCPAAWGGGGAPHQTQRYVHVYNLVKQELMQKLQTGMRWISSLDVHPQGDNVVVGSYDRRLCWFDLDLSTSPYKVLRFHSEAIRQVCFHRRYPLFASCSDDNSIHVFHGMVYNDLLQNPLIVPVKILRGHRTADSLGAFGAVAGRVVRPCANSRSPAASLSPPLSRTPLQACWTASSIPLSRGSSALARTQPSACTLRRPLPKQPNAAQLVHSPALAQQPSGSRRGPCCMFRSMTMRGLVDVGR